MDITPASQPSAAGSPRTGKRIILTTLGSLGDLHPYIAIALGLKARGHLAVVATGECYRGKIEPLGLGFLALRPDSDFVADHDQMRRIMDFRWGTFRVLRELILPAIRQTYQDTLAAVEGGADLLVSHPLTFATGLVAEKLGIPWSSTQVTPLGLFSAHDPPLPPGFPDLADRLRFLGPMFWGPVGRSLKWATRPWAGPIDRLRAEIGLRPSGDNPLVDGHSPSLVLALFSKLLSDKQADWPPQVVHTGFPVYDRDGEAGLPAELARFLDAGPPPVVFTLGHSAAMVAGEFFEHSLATARALGVRAILVLGKGHPLPPAPLPEGVVAFEYAPFSGLFPRASVVVHAGGIGTTGMAMCSGRPSLVVPFAHDQPDNAARLTRLGIARTLTRHRFTPSRAVVELRHLIEEPTYSERASKVGELVRREDGVQAACDALEVMLHGTGRT